MKRTPEGIKRAVEATEKGLLAIRLFKIALATDPELSLGDAERMEIKRAWSLTKYLLGPAEIEAFEEMLKQMLKQRLTD